MRLWAAFALGSAFSQIPDKQQALNDLHRLTNNQDVYVRTSSNHSLGKVALYKAIQVNKEEDYKNAHEILRITCPNK